VSLAPALFGLRHKEANSTAAAALIYRIIIYVKKLFIFLKERNLGLFVSTDTKKRTQFFK
jgi:hypothetical protein